jgi:thiosulfate dehydrogenase
MSEQTTTGRWVAGVIFAGLAVLIGYSLPHGTKGGEGTATPVATTKPASAPAVSSSGDAQPAPAKSASSTGDKTAGFTPPPDSAIPDNGFGKMVRLGQAIFNDTQTHAKGYVGNDLRCSNCHLGRGRVADSAPLWAAYVSYPAYRSKNGHVNSFQERLQGCFRYSMNGKAPELGSDVLVALQSYAYFLAKGLPTGNTKVAGRGYPKLAKPESFDMANGAKVFAANCSLCHGDDGQGQKAADGTTVFPPLWGPKSFNWGAGMGKIDKAASFIKANMPFSRRNTLSDKDAWDVAAFMDSHERPQDPRFTGSVAETRQKFHNSKMSLYGTKVGDRLLGENSPPSGTVD